MDTNIYRTALSAREIAYLRVTLLGLEHPQQLAEKLLVSAQAVINWEQGNAPNRRNMKELCNLWNGAIKA